MLSGASKELEKRLGLSECSFIRVSAGMKSRHDLLEFVSEIGVQWAQTQLCVRKPPTSLVLPSLMNPLQPTAHVGCRLVKRLRGLVATYAWKFRERVA